MHDIMQIPLDKLIESPHNARTAPASAQADKELLASIGSIGLQSALIVTSSVTGEYEVVAGMRRVTAMRILAANDDYDTISNDTLVPCIVKNADTDNINEISLVENTHRAALHPADEFARYQELNVCGMAPAEIATHFGVTQRHVLQRLKLATVHPEIVADYRNGDCDLEMIMTFTIEDSQDRQLTIWQSAKQQNATNQWDILRALKETKLSCNNSLVKFVSNEVYIANGGTITTDLFDDNAYANDPQLIYDLAMEKLAQHAAQLKKQGWKWVDISLKEPHEMIGRCHHIDSENAVQPAALNKKLEDIKNRLEELESTSRDDMTTETQEKLADECEELYQQEEALDDQIEDYFADNQIYNTAEIPLAGCAIFIDNSQLKTYQGLVKKEDVKALRALRDSDTPESTGDSEHATAQIQEQTDDDTIELSQALRTDLARHRLHITQTALAKNAALARDTLYFSLCTAVLGKESDRYSHHETPVNLQTQENISTNDIARLDLNSSKAGKEIKTLRDSLETKWISANSNADQFEQFQALSSAKKQSLMAYCTAKLLCGDIATNHINAAELITDQLNIKWHKYFRPTAENYLSRVNKSTLAEIGKPFLDDWAADVNNYKKSALAEQLADVFAGKDDRVSAEARPKALKWVPPAIALIE